MQILSPYIYIYIYIWRHCLIVCSHVVFDYRNYCSAPSSLCTIAVKLIPHRSQKFHSGHTYFAALALPSCDRHVTDNCTTRIGAAPYGFAPLLLGRSASAYSLLPRAPHAGEQQRQQQRHQLHVVLVGAAGEQQQRQSGSGSPTTRCAWCPWGPRGSSSTRWT